MKKILCFVLMLVLVLVLDSAPAAAQTASPSPTPVVLCHESAIRVEHFYLEYIAALGVIREKAIKDGQADRKIQLDAKIAATKYCVSALRKEFGLPKE
jgi:hypothetical protein